jgi:hypothetical protein
MIKTYSKRLLVALLMVSSLHAGVDKKSLKEIASLLDAKIATTKRSLTVPLKASCLAIVENDECPADIALTALKNTYKNLSQQGVLTQDEVKLLAVALVDAEIKQAEADGKTREWEESLTIAGTLHVNGQTTMRDDVLVVNDYNYGSGEIEMVLKSMSGDDCSSFQTKDHFNVPTFKIKAETGDTLIRGRTTLKNNVSLYNGAEDNHASLSIQSHSCHDASALQTRDHDSDVTFKVEAESGDVTTYGLITHKNNVIVHNSCDNNSASLTLKSNSDEDLSALETRNHNCDLTFKVKAETGETTIAGQTTHKNSVTVRSCEDDQAFVKIESNSDDDCSALETRNHDSETTFKVKAETGETEIKGGLTVSNSCHDDLSFITIKSHSSDDYSALVTRDHDSDLTFKVEAETGDTTIHGQTNLKKRLILRSCENNQGIELKSHSCNDEAVLVTKNHSGHATFTVAAQTGDASMKGSFNIDGALRGFESITAEEGIFVRTGGVTARAGGVTAIAGGLTALKGGLNIESGGARVKGNTKLMGALGVCGKTRLENTLHVEGDVNFESDLNVDGNYTSTNGNITLTNGTLTVKELTVTNDVHISGGLWVGSLPTAGLLSGFSTLVVLDGRLHVLAGI